jgi:mRNA interferase HigB
VHIITTKRINQYAGQYPEAAQALFTWVKVVEKANWNNLNDLKAAYPRADMVGDNRYVFNIKGNLPFDRSH